MRGVISEQELGVSQAVSIGAFEVFADKIGDLPSAQLHELKGSHPRNTPLALSLALLRLGPFAGAEACNQPWALVLWSSIVWVVPRSWQVPRLEATCAGCGAP